MILRNAISKPVIAELPFLCKFIFVPATCPDLPNWVFLKVLESIKIEGLIRAE